jgi:hypothetical protein
MNAKLAASIAALAAVAVPAWGQLYKCKGPDGKVVYSDTRCEAADTGALKVNPNSTTPSEREKAATEAAAKAREDAARDKAEGEKLKRQLEAAGVQIAPAPSTPQPAAAKGPYELTGSDRDRLRGLEMTANSVGATSEAKSAAQYEISQIRSGRDAQLTSDQRSRRESLRTDVSSVDAQKRRDALQQFRAVYY